MDPLATFGAAELLDCEHDGVDLDLIAERPRWMRRGACVHADPEAFFPENGGRGEAAKAICAGCPVTEVCRDHALAHGLLGVWGGTNEHERRALRQERRQGAAA